MPAMPYWRKRLITDEWIATVRNRFAERGRGAQAQVCREVKERYGEELKEGTLSLMLKPDRQASSSWVEPVSEILKIQLPPISADDGLLGRLMSAGAEMGEAELKNLVAIAESLAGK